jgi:HNH endonuclease
MPIILQLWHTLDGAIALPTHFMNVLLRMAMNNLDGWEWITNAHTVSNSSSVCDAALDYYDLAAKNYCQILGENTKHVVNAHIWPHHNKRNLVLVDLQPTDADKPRNILRLHRDIEYHFDHKDVTFIQSGSDVFCLKVLNPKIGIKTLLGTTVTFDKIDGRPLCFPREKMPWRRLLSTHSIFAHRFARDMGWLLDDALTAAEVNANELLEFSLDGEAQDRMKRFLQST